MFVKEGAVEKIRPEKTGTILRPIYCFIDRRSQQIAHDEK